MLRTPARSLLALSSRAPKAFWLALAGLIAVAAVTVHLKIISTVEPVDFFVYRYGVFEAFKSADIYSANIDGPLMPEGGLPYTYTPFAVFFLVPATFFTWQIAFFLWSIATLAGFVYAMWLMVPETRQRIWMIPLFTLASGATALVSHHLHFGQVNVFLMLLVLVDLTRSDRSAMSRYIPRGTLVGIAAAIKLTPGFFMLFFLITGQWRLFWAASVSFVSCMLIGAVFFSDMTVQFFTDTLWTLGTRVSLTGDLGTSGNNSLTGLLTAIGPVPKLINIIVLVIVAVYILLPARQAHLRAESTAAWLIIGLSAPLLSPVSWIHHWVYLIPAVVYLVFTRVQMPRHKALAIALWMLLASGPDLGDMLFSLEQPLLWTLAALLRQSLMISSIIAIFWLSSNKQRSSRAAPLPAISTLQRS